MQKRKKIIGLLLMSCALAFTLSATACSDGKDGIDGVNGTDGKSAYQIWLDNGYTGTEADFLEWLKGEDGTDGKDGTNGNNGIDGVNGTNGVDGKDGANGTNGVDGRSAYQIWLDNGNTGNETDFLEWLKGADGKDGTNGIDGVNGSDGKDGTDGKDGINGKSAYQIWLDNGNTGSETDFLEWLKGEDGTNGTNGKDGVNGTNGKDGTNGLSAYEIFIKYNPDYPNNEEQWIEDLVNGKLVRYTVTFKAYGQEDIILKTQYNVNKLTDIPQVPTLAGNVGAWDYNDFENITQDITVNAVYETQGLMYSLVGDSYSVTGFENETAEVVFIPQTYNGKNVTSIGEFAFFECSSLKNVQISENVTSIGQFAFAESGLTNIIIPDSVISISQRAFQNCRSLTSVRLSNNLTCISEYMFFVCSSLTSITIPNNVTSIGQCAFAECSRLTSIEIPKSVTLIGNKAFSDTWNTLMVVYYKGSAEDWAAITIGSDNTKLTSATLYYYSETEPAFNSDGTAYNGNYWHYDTDGVTPIIWTVKQDEEN